MAGPEIQHTISASVGSNSSPKRFQPLGYVIDMASRPDRPVLDRGSSDSSVSKGKGRRLLGLSTEIPTDSKDRSFSDPRSSLASTVKQDHDNDVPATPVPASEIQGDYPQRPFVISTDILVAKSPYFARMVEENSPALQTPFSFADLDDFALSLFRHWLYGGKLHGPHDFHSMNHYQCLYVIGLRFEIEALRNDVMDLVRGYYRRGEMTSPAYRLEYIYTNTKGHNLMREFLITTAAYRTMTKGGFPMSQSTKNVLRHDGDAAIDFIEALVKLGKNGRVDVRKGDNCRWHEHRDTQKCPKWSGFEPFQSP